jgi:hypothetical protein
MYEPQQSDDDLTSDIGYGLRAGLKLPIDACRGSPLA